MAEIVNENPHMERFHGTAKNDYLIPRKVNSIGVNLFQAPTAVGMRQVVIDLMDQDRNDLLLTADDWRLFK